jgi:hypothetical protein
MEMLNGFEQAEAGLIRGLGSKDIGKLALGSYLEDISLGTVKFSSDGIGYSPSEAF